MILWRVDRSSCKYKCTNATLCRDTKLSISICQTYRSSEILSPAQLRAFNNFSAKARTLFLPLGGQTFFAIFFIYFLLTVFRVCKRLPKQNMFSKRIGPLNKKMVPVDFVGPVIISQMFIKPIFWIKCSKIITNVHKHNITYTGHAKPKIKLYIVNKQQIPVFQNVKLCLFC